MITIKSPNWKKVAAQMKGAKKLNTENIQKGLEKAVIKISADAVRQAPVKTGTLRRSITQYARGSKIKKTSGQMVAKVGSKTHYAIHQEQGTRYIRAKKFLIGAIEKNRSYVSKLLGVAMSNTIRKA